MAVVNVDLSEYDMLRNSLKEARDNVSKLEKENEGLKNNSKVIVRTEHHHHYTQFNIDIIVETLHNYIRNGNYISRENVREAINMASSDHLLRESYSDNEKSFIESSCQCINFEDIKIQVEDVLRKEAKQRIDSEIKRYKESEKNYREKYDKLEEDFQKDTDVFKTSLKKKYDLKLQEKDEKIEKYEKEITKLQETIKELSKTQEEKEAQALAELNEAKLKYEQLVNSKNKGWFNRLFK